MTIEHIQEEVLLNTKDEYMKEELITHADSVTNKKPPTGILFNTNKQFMKESNNHAVNANIN